MLRVGLTGGVGSGKSTVAEVFARRGAKVIDADAIAREVVEPGTMGFEAVKARFGREIARPDGIDRAALARIVFADDDARDDLNGIVHPLVRFEIQERIATLAESTEIVVLMIPLLVESGRYATDIVIVVDCDEEVAIQRMVTSRGWTERDARSRIAAQATRTQRRAIADIVIDNSTDEVSLERQVDAAWQRLTERLVEVPR